MVAPSLQMYLARLQQLIPEVKADPSSPAAAELQHLVSLHVSPVPNLPACQERVVRC